MITIPLLILLGSLILLLILGVPIYASLGLSSLLTFFLTADMPSTIIAQKFFSNIFSFPLMAIPFFLLTSSVMENSGLSHRIINLVDGLLGNIRGKLAISGLLACVLFSAISGSSVATVASIGGILIPRMLKEGYDRRLAVGSIVAGGTLGILIPPSIPLIVYGLVTGTSITKLFLAAVVPGILLAGAFILTALVMIKKGLPAGTTEKTTWPERKGKIRQGIWTLLIPLGIFVGIYGIPGVASAIFTPTEASIAAFLLAIIVAIFIYRGIRLRDLPRVVAESSNHIGMIVMIIASALLFSFVVNNARIPQVLAEYLVSIHLSPILFLLLVNVLLFLAGDFMDAVPIIMIFMPVLYPTAIALGINPIHFGIMTVVNMELGCITPPVGLNLFMASNISKLPVTAILKASLPWIMVILIVLMMVTYIPGISLWLPNTMLP
jgi:C4-dicarboxylate transporter DctM subunit